MGPAGHAIGGRQRRLRVHGLTGLRIAETSIMPTISAANTAAPTMMIGERAAAFVSTTRVDAASCAQVIPGLSRVFRFIVSLDRPTKRQEAQCHIQAMRGRITINP